MIQKGSGRSNSIIPSSSSSESSKRKKKKNSRRCKSNNNNDDNDKIRTQPPSPWHDLPSDILISIVSRLRPSDCLRSSIVCRSWHRPITDNIFPPSPILLLSLPDLSLAPLQPLTKLLPVYAYDPCCYRRYKTNIFLANPPIYTKTLAYKFGWLLLLKYQDPHPVFFFFHLTTRKKILLPTYTKDKNTRAFFRSKFIAAFSAPPSSSDCLTVIIRDMNPFCVEIRTCQYSNYYWKVQTQIYDIDFVRTSNIVFRGPLYYLGSLYAPCIDSLYLKLKLDVYGPDEFHLSFQACEIPGIHNCPATCAYLIELKEELLILVMGQWWYPVRVFKIHLSMETSTIALENIWNLGDNTIYISRNGADMVTARSAWMANKVYFPSNYRGLWRFFSMENHPCYNRGMLKFLLASFNGFCERIWIDAASIGGKQTCKLI